ncbi:hypothetical protein ACT43X_18825 (plasmid) [Acinetobacter baumannii]
MNKFTVLLTALMSMSSYLHAQDQPTPPSLTTTNNGQIEVTKDDKTTSISKVPNSPLINTITSVTKPSNMTVQNDEQRIDTSDITNSLSQADLDYIKAVNSNDKINSIESKIVNNEAISREELRILRQKNPNY